MDRECPFEESFSLCVLALILIDIGKIGYSHRKLRVICAQGPHFNRQCTLLIILSLGQIALRPINHAKVSKNLPHIGVVWSKACSRIRSARVSCAAASVYLPCDHKALARPTREAATSR